MAEAKKYGVANMSTTYTADCPHCKNPSLSYSRFDLPKIGQCSNCERPTRLSWDERGELKKEPIP